MKNTLRLLAVACILLSLSSCSLVQLFRLKPLSATEKSLLGTWTCNDFLFEQTYTFRQDRTCHYEDLSRSPVQTEDWVWEADTARVTFYSPDAAFLDPDQVNRYSMSSSGAMVLEDATFTRE